MNARYQHSFCLNRQEEERLQALLKQGKRLIDIIRSGIEQVEQAEKKASK